MKKKNVIAAALTISAMVSSIGAYGVVASASDGFEPEVRLFNNYSSTYTCISEGTMIDSNGRIQLGIRAFAEAAGAQVSWDGINRQVMLNKDGTTVYMHIGQFYYDVYYANGESEVRYMDTCPYISDNKTLIPLRYAAEALNYNVSWDSQLGIAYCTNN